MAHRIYFALQAKGGQQDVKYLVCRIKWESSRQILALSMGFRVNPEKWSAPAQRCLPGSFHGPSKIPAAEINGEIDRYTLAIGEVFTELGASPERDEVARRIRMKLGLRSAKGTPGVREAFRVFLSEQSTLQGWSSGTLTKMGVVGRHIDDSGLFRTFSDFTTARLQQYLNYMRADLGLTDVTVHRHVGYLRWFLRWAAEEKGWLSLPDWRTFSPKLKTPAKPVIYLEWEELMAVWNFHDPKRPWLDAVRDQFCFCAFTSLRFSDAVALTWADVSPDSIRVTTQKTHDALVIELNKWSREILARRQAVRKGPRVFTSMTNQVMNRALKEICKDCGMDTPVRLTTYKGGERIDVVKEKWELIGTHAARRTFVVNALQMGISPTVVMQWTGHSGYDSMRPYIAVADAARAKAMSGFDSLDK